MQKMKDSGIKWIGKIPTEWSIIKAKYILVANDGGVWGEDPTGEESDKVVIRSTEQTVDGKWCIDAPAKRDLSKEKKISSRIRSGDLLITKSSGSDLHIGKTTIADSYFDEHECYYSNFIQRIRCNAGYCSRYLWYLFNSSIVRDQFVYLQNSTSGIGNINADIIGSVFLPYPNSTNQEIIVSFLDGKCTEIDAVIEKTKTTIEEYKKLKQSVITEAITKGVRGERFMKDSKVEWLKTVPVEWDMICGKGLFAETNARSATGEEELLTVSQYTGVTPRSQKNVNMFEAESLEGYKICEVGDIAANTMWLWAGAIGVSEYEGVISPSYNIYRQLKETYNTKYLDYLLRVEPLVQCYESMSTGIRASRLRLYPQQFLSIKFPVPPMAEQLEIVSYLNNKCAEMDDLISRKTALLEEMESYKKSVIYEYVTGKKEVNEDGI